MTPNDRERCWERYDRDEDDFPRSNRGYHEEDTHPDPEPDAADEAAAASVEAEEEQ